MKINSFSSNFNQNKKNPAFTSTIKFVDFKTFRDLKAGSRTNFLESKKVFDGLTPPIQGVSNFCAGGITDGKKTLMFKMPLKWGEKELIKFTKEMTEDLRSMGGNLKGLILGGSNARSSARSNEKTFSFMENFFEKSNISYSEFKGVTKGADFKSMYLYNPKEDAWYLTNKHISKNPKSDSRLSELVWNNFRDVKLSEADEIKGAFQDEVYCSKRFKL